MKIMFSSLGGSWKAPQGRVRLLFYVLVFCILVLFLAAGWGFYLLLRWAFVQSLLLGLFIFFFVVPALGRAVFMGLMFLLPFLITLFSGSHAPGEGGQDPDDGVVDVQAKILS